MSTTIAETAKITETAIGQFAISGVLNRSTLNEFWPKSVSVLKQANMEAQDVVISLAGVEHADTAALAWLLNLVRDAKQQKFSFQLKNVPQTLINLAKISDVDGFLPLQ